MHDGTDTRQARTATTEERRRWRPRLRGEQGQATVEYVGLAVGVAVLLVSLGTGLGGQGGKVGAAVVKQLTKAIDGVAG